jgi:hypothetical protein
MQKDEADYEWIWDACFFGGGLLLLLNEFDRSQGIMAPVTEVSGGSSVPPDARICFCTSYANSYRPLISRLDAISGRAWCAPDDFRTDTMISTTDEICESDQLLQGPSTCGEMSAYTAPAAATRRMR